jgi:ATP-binding cassette subfamily B protein
MTSVLKASSCRTDLRALRETRAFWPHLGLIFVMGLLEAPLGLVTPVPMKVIVDSVVGGAPPPAWLDPALFGLEKRALFPLAVGLTVALAFVWPSAGRMVLS